MCDAHHAECYPATRALAEPNVRLARYDQIEHTKDFIASRFLYIIPQDMCNKKKIKQLCEEILNSKNDMTMKNKVEGIFNQIKQNSSMKTSIGALIKIKKEEKEKSGTFEKSMDVIIRKLTTILGLEKFLQQNKKSAEEAWGYNSKQKSLELCALLFKESMYLLALENFKKMDSQKIKILYLWRKSHKVVKAMKFYINYVF